MTALASMYGYKTIGGLISDNSGLIVILTAFIFVCLVFRVLLNRQFPSGAGQPAKVWIFKTTMIFFICAFIFVCGFTVFYEKKKLDAQSRAPVEMIKPNQYLPPNQLLKC